MERILKKFIIEVKTGVFVTAHAYSREHTKEMYPNAKNIYEQIQLPLTNQ